MRSALLLAVFGFIFFSVPAQTKKTLAKTSANPVAAKSPAGYEIKVKITPLKNTLIYLYNHYGKTNYQVADSTVLNSNSEGVFSGNKKLPQGIYLIVTDKRVRLFDVLMDNTQHFTVVADTSHPDKPAFSGSADNALYQNYTSFLSKTVPKITELQKQLSAAKSKEDSSKLQTAYTAVNKEMTEYRNNVAKKNPESLLAAFFNAMKRPEVPEFNVASDSLKQLYGYRYMQEHYWDDVDFSTEALVRTPFFEPKLEEYFKYYVSPDADSIIPQVKYMLLASRSSTEMYRFLLAKFTNKYINPEIMGQDKVFVYLFENHYLKGDTSFLSAKDRETIFKRGWSLIANQIGEVAPQLSLTSIDNTPVNLYETNADYTLVVFWDPNCGHCKTEIPRVDSIYRAKWKNLGLKVFAVNVDEAALKVWNDFVKQYRLQEWTHAYQTKSARDAEAAAGQPNFRQLYDVYKTPTLYLLDKQKRIIAKNLEISGFDEVLSAAKTN